MLHLMRDLTPLWQWQLKVLHCNHRWSPAETDCADFVQAHALQLGIPADVVTADTIYRDENRARQWRYRMLAQEADRWDCEAIATAHTGSDRAETFLYNLIRGSGSSGLASLKWSRPLNSEWGPEPSPSSSPPMPSLHSAAPAITSLIRPLLGVWRQETADYCQLQKIPIWEDPFNQDLSHPRNRLRLDVIPYLKEHLNPKVELALNRTATLLEANNDCLNQQMEDLWTNIYERSPICLDRVALQKTPVAIQRQLIHKFLSLHLPHAASFEQVEMLRKLISSPRRTKTSTFPGGFWGEVVSSKIVWRKGVGPLPS